MFRLWARAFKNNQMLRDTCICDSSDQNRTAKVFGGLTKVCREFDLPEPIWLEANIREFKRLSRTRFRQDSFIEEIDFDYLEIRVIEED